MSVLKATRFTTVTKAGQRFRVPAERDFYIRYLMQSQFHARIATLADRVELLIKDRGGTTKFNREKFYMAAGLCVYAHRKQIRKLSKLPYADHPITLAERAVDILYVTNVEELIAGLLHDVVEDTEFDLKFIQRKFGRVVADLVDGMTKITQLEEDRLINEQNIDKFVDALAGDIRVLRIKMIDRGINLEDADQLSEESRGRNCGEALDYYVPLGILCGFMKAARHLSDIAFEKLNPKRYAEIKDIIEGTEKSNKELLEHLQSEIKKKYKQNIKEGIPRESWGRPEVRKYFSKKTVEVFDKPRTVYEVDQIATMRGTETRHLSDIVMMQVTVDSINDCYTMLNTIHSLGIPIDRYWHDYIKDPKINGYQSLHTGILVGETLIRFQIRTQKMQKIAQAGVLFGAYTPTGKFKQPKLPWLKEAWLRIILQVRDRRAKILLTKSLAQARLATVMVEGSSMNTTYQDILLPRGITPLEIAFIADPMLGLHLVGAFYKDVVRNLNESIEEGIGFIKLQIADEIQYRDYIKLLRNPLARLRFVEYLESKNEEYRVKFVSQILENRLSELFLNLENLEKIDPKKIETLLSRMADGEASAEETIEGIRNMVKQTDEGILVLERMELKPGERMPEEVLENIRQILPIERYGFEGSSLKLSFSLRNAAQETQFANFMVNLENSGGVHITSHEEIRPPIIDHVSLNHHSLYYSHDLALRAAQALQAQRGRVFDINLNPLALGLMPDDFKSEYGQIFSEHINQAEILFFSGYKQDVDIFREFLKILVEEGVAAPPLMVLFERIGMFDVESIVHPLRDLVEIPYIGISQIGHNSNFLLQCLAQRLGVPAPA